MYCNLVQHFLPVMGYHNDIIVVRMCDKRRTISHNCYNYSRCMSYWCFVTALYICSYDYTVHMNLLTELQMTYANTYVWYFSSYIVIPFCVLLKSDFLTKKNYNKSYILSLHVQFSNDFIIIVQSWNGILHILHVNLFLQLYIWLWDFFLYTKHKLQP